MSNEMSLITEINLLERSSSPSLILTNNSNVLNKQLSSFVEPCRTTKHSILLKPVCDPTVINLISTEQQTCTIDSNDSSTTTSTSTMNHNTSNLDGFRLLVDVAVKELHRIQQAGNNSVPLLCN